MTEQMTVTGVFVLCSGIGLFWGTVALIVRVHRHGRTQAEPEARR